MCNLVQEEFTQLLLNLGSSSFFRCGWIWWWSCGCWCRCNVSKVGHHFWFEPHIRKHLTDTFLDIRTQVTIACTIGWTRKSSGFGWIKSEHPRKTIAVPLRRNHPCINSWASIAPVSNLYVNQDLSRPDSRTRSQYKRTWKYHGLKQLTLADN